MSELHERESSVILEEITDLIAYLGGLPEHLLSSGAFDSYKLRLQELDGELARSQPTGMQWKDYNDLSQRYAGFELYELAAMAAERAIEVLDPSKQKTLGITAIGAAAFWLKAGNFREAQRVCDFWITEAKKEVFPDFAAVELEEILKTIQSRYELKPEDIFSYGEPIKRDKKYLFVGRDEDIKKAIKVIESDFSLLIKGEEGVGKTSFAWQLMELLSGVAETCDSLNYFPEKYAHCIWLDCNSTMKTPEDILINLLHPSCADYTCSRLFPLAYKTAYKTSTIEHEITSLYDSRIDSGAIRVSINEVFNAVLEIIQDQKLSQRTVLFLDSFDLISDHVDIRKLVELTHESIQYILLSGDERSIINDVNPLAMQVFEEHRINRWKSESIDELLSIIEKRHLIKFTTDSREKIAKESESLPALFHELGVEAVQEALNCEADPMNLLIINENYLALTTSINKKRSKPKIINRASEISSHQAKFT
jgi:hypothetical protein